MTFHNEWIPLSSEQVQEPSLETHRSRYRWRKDGNNKKQYMKSLKPPPLEITTSYPFRFEASSIVPQLTSYSSAFSNYNLHKKFIESNQSPLIGTIEQPKLFSELRHDFDKMNNHRANYEVTELIPAESNINTIISIPDDNMLVLSNEGPTTEEPIKQTYVKVKSTQRPRNPRNRGRVNYRASMK
ncbi:hypothetical protein NQ314_019342 [Rhamnusium bicolor]|uniref:Uncharacterized protein n=1 Tax=Rhamnusium bicolor TaxID=1586634 RepID=A0AAV8WPN8_9CUCU|nr:hypothetical protein NQ314_019342 [Rhamnusium bicolor]